MTDYVTSSQAQHWIFTQQQLDYCRRRANVEARGKITEYKESIKQKQEDLMTSSDDNNVSALSEEDRKTIEPSNFAASLRGYFGDQINDSSFEIQDDDESESKFLSVEEEQELVRFYSGKISLVIGPSAQISRLRRPDKVSATACLLFRRFYLSNSVMVFDPKAIMVASAFLASKVEDVTADVRYLSEATALMQASVSVDDILKAELHLVSGLNFELMCFHAYKPVVALTEDLRTYLKSENGRKTISAGSRVVTGGDLRSRFDNAKRLIDDICTSDIPLLYSTGQIGLAALMVANEDIQDKAQSEGNTDFPAIDLYSYLNCRFKTMHLTDDKCSSAKSKMVNLTQMIRELEGGKHGCGSHGVDMVVLKKIHKKLKKCRVWGVSDEKSKKKKRKVEESSST